jgi:hypothetical protein
MRPAGAHRPNLRLAGFEFRVWLVVCDGLGLLTTVPLGPKVSG